MLYTRVKLLEQQANTKTPAPQAAAPDGNNVPAPETGSPVETPNALWKHRSFFVVPAAAQTELTIYNFSLPGIQNALREESAAKNDLNQKIKEVTLTTLTGPISLSEFLPLFIKESVGSDVAPAFVDLSKFEDDFTAFLYYDESGVWPGYVARIKDGEDSLVIKTRLIEVESSFDLSAFYLGQPGTFKEFKDGTYNKMKTRYAVGGQSGASFNYTFFGTNTLVLSTSFNGLKAAISLIDRTVF